MSKIVNITFAGIGGQGVLKASDILAEAAFRSGLDVKKSEVHGMSQRGGSVCSDVRYGEAVSSPMIPEGETDFLVVFDDTQIEVNALKLRKGGVMITPGDIKMDELENKKSLNVALLGALSKHLDISKDILLDAIKSFLPEKLHEVNFKAFETGAK
jgi:indolepyruvate ferredoxin oxidoreductase beta subunit